MNEQTFGCGEWSIQAQNVRSHIREYLGEKIYPKVQDAVKEGNLNFYVAGGAITSVFTGAKVNDLDIYFPSHSDEDVFRDLLLTGKEKDDNFKQVCKTDNATTIVRYEAKHRKYVVQLISRFYFEKPEDCIKSFDFSIVQGAYDFKNKKIVLGPYFISDNLKRVLRYTNTSKYPICALYRTKKYVARGYKLPGTTMVAIALAINALSIRSFADLKDQLMGIDTQAFTLILKDFEKNHSEELKFELDMMRERWYGQFLEQLISGAFGDEESEDCISLY